MSLNGDFQEQAIGLIAGNGQLPLLFAQALPKHRIIAVGHSGETDPRLATLVSAFCWVRLGQFQKILDFFLQHRVKWVVMAGGITKSRIWQARPDFLAIKMIMGLLHRHDDLLLRSAAAILQEHGLQLKSVTDFVPQLLAPAGLLSRRQPTAAEWEDIRFGWWAAKELGRLDIGQGVVVRQKMVAAVEAMEGTDAMLLRAGPLLAGKGWEEGGGVVVKVAKPMQDRRLDLPTIGPRTITTMHEAGLRVLAVEAGGALLLEPEQTRALVDRYDLVLLGCRAEEMQSSEPAADIG
ncbi:LpxI family protein [Candidatus Magnetaquicoccus inordinatus]|uniref:LpxI family protein n=1 Tax=Candidatus Magnetaquicoccus inordinatus TaxID=2496818 RepID=UPI001D0E35BB|nr:UDP-2,3-diacylglucosamine diphosphatase LpxI [Candidatus Magnetaquicoccus inordinatus]